MEQHTFSQFWQWRIYKRMEANICYRLGRKNQTGNESLLLTINSSSVIIRTLFESFFLSFVLQESYMDQIEIYCNKMEDLTNTFPYIAKTVEKCALQAVSSVCQVGCRTFCLMDDLSFGYHSLCGDVGRKTLWEFSIRGVEVYWWIRWTQWLKTSYLKLTATIIITVLDVDRWSVN